MLKKLSVKLALENLVYWQFIGIANDIYECPSNRIEYSIHVGEAMNLGLYETEIVDYTIRKLGEELLLPWYKRPTFWLLLKLTIKRAFRII